MDIHTNSVEPNTAEPANAPAQSDPSPTIAFVATPPAEATAAPIVNLAFDAFGHPHKGEPAAPSIEPSVSAPAALAAAPEVAPSVREAATPRRTTDGAAVISIAGLHAAGPAAQGTLWRKIRAADGSERRAANAPRQQAPIIPPPEQRARSAAAAAGSAARKGRFALLAASIALVAGVGAAAGAAGFAGVAKLMTPEPKRITSFAPTPAPLHRADLAEETRVVKDGLAQVRGSIRGLSENVGSVRANVDNSGKAAAAQIARLNDQVAKLTDTVNRIEHSQAEPAAKLAKVIETLEKLEHRAAALAGADAPARHTASAAPAPAPDTTGSVAAAANVIRGTPPQPLRPPTVDGWAVRGVFNGIALLDGPDRAIEVEEGDNIRGVGRVQEIKRQGNRWIVTTSRGLIVSR